MAAGVLLAAVFAALALGFLAGWLAWGRTAAAARAAETALAAANERAAAAELLRKTLDGVVRERDAALIAARELEARQQERERAFDEQRRQLVEAKEALSQQFGEIGQKLLGEAQRAFLERADQRFAQAGEKSEAQLKALLTPVETTLKRYEEGLALVEKDRVGSYEALKQAVAQLAQGNEVVRKEAARLTNVLRSSPKHRGRWGEEQLRTILESAGLAENVDFELQTAVNDGERQLRPDCVIRLPGGRCIVVDVKCPLVAFEQAFDEEDEGRRAELLLAHANAMRSYAADLGRKSYWQKFDLSPDFVIMFIPGEHFLAAAAERAPELIEQAFRGGVIVASTINMLALAKVMAGMWRQEGLAQQAQEVGRLGKELYARLQTMGGHVEKLGKNLATATGAYNAFVGSLETSVLPQARRFEALSIDTAGKTIEPPPLVETAIRPLTKLAANTAEAAE